MIEKLAAIACSSSAEAGGRPVGLPLRALGVACSLACVAVDLLKVFEDRGSVDGDRFEQAERLLAAAVGELPGQLLPRRRLSGSTAGTDYGIF